VGPGRTAVAATVVALALPALAWATFERPCDRDAARDVAIFYYAWYGTPARDGAWLHWSQGGSRPPRDVGATFYPARGPYSSSDAAVVDAHMRDMAEAGVTTVVVSWWGRGSIEDAHLPHLKTAAARQRLRLAVHVEPYANRTVETVAADLAHLRSLGIRDVYVYDSSTLPDQDWATLNGLVDDMRLFANTRLPGKAKAGGFDGLYTYDVLLYDGDLFPRLCAQARRLGLLCAPSVGPGYDARNATPDRRIRPRRSGATYDEMWRGAIRSYADVVTITSYNEWHEGTQIEPARPAGDRYQSYDGAWGTSGVAAQRAYLERTTYWSFRFRGGPHGVIIP
jgi:glycoprotein endo-alpha-1,2-mannosidase